MTLTNCWRFGESNLIYVLGGEPRKTANTVRQRKVDGEGTVAQKLADLLVRQQCEKSERENVITIGTFFSHQTRAGPWSPRARFLVPKRKIYTSPFR